MKIYIICAVRKASEEYKKKLEEYTFQLESEGHEVHLPHRDVDQSQSGLTICKDHRWAMDQCDRVDIFYSPDSQGTHFDIGMAFALLSEV